MPADHPTPGNSRFFEDYPEGQRFELGSFTVSEEEIIAFAEQYDPQYFHTDPEKAASGPYGRVIASGWHTVALMMRLLATRYLDVSALASPGIDDLRWHKPVFGGDVLSVAVDVTEARRSRSKPDRGIVRSAITVSDKAGEPVMTMTALNMIRARP